MTAPWVSLTDAEPAPECNRGDCAERAVVVRYWRSGSGRRWVTRKCAEHAVEPDPARELPGFRFLSELAVHPPLSGDKDPSQVG